jgi:hypothetical protein
LHSARFFLDRQQRGKKTVYQNLWLSDERVRLGQNGGRDESL